MLLAAASLNSGEAGSCGAVQYDLFPGHAIIGPRDSLKMLLRLALIFQIWAALIDPTSGAGCEMQGVCFEEGSISAPCPAPLNATTVEAPHSDQDFDKLRDLCPHLFTDGNEVCCNKPQARGLVKQLESFNSVFQRCSSCVDNFAKLWCDFTCSPNQQNFVKVLKTAEKDGTRYVTDAQYRLSKDFAEGVLRSCRSVMLGDLPAISLMCQGLGRSQCTVQTWLNFIGTKNPSAGIPINIKFDLIDKPTADNTTLDLFNETSREDFNDQTATPCNVSPRMGRDACPRSDCDQYPEKKIIDYTIPVEEEVRFSILLPIDTSRLFLGATIILSIMVFYCVWCVLSRRKKARREERSYAPGRLHRTGAWIERQLESGCTEYGRLVARNPYNAIATGLVIAMIACSGMIHFSLVSDPVEIWSSPNSRARQEKNFFDAKFGSFQRIEQVTFVTKSDLRSDELLPGAIFDQAHFEEILNVVKEIENITVLWPGSKRTSARSITLQDVCFRPMGPKADCLVMTPTGYFQDDLEKMKLNFTPIQSEDDFNYDDPESGPAFPLHIKECLTTPMNINTKAGLSCLGLYGGPIFPNMVFGQHPERSVEESHVATVTYTLNRIDSEEDREKALIWEAAFIEKLKNYKVRHPNITISFMAERSIEDELTNEATDDIGTIVLSMFLALMLIIVNLGEYRVLDNKLATLLVHSKGLIALLSILIMVISTFCSVGVFCYLNVKATKNAMPVLFFMVMSVAINHIFIYVQTYQRWWRKDGRTSLEERFGLLCGQTMPTILLSVVSSSFCFSMGALTPMPAVSSFSPYAGLGLVFNFILQSTILLGALLLDIRREEDGRIEITQQKMVEIDEVVEAEGYVMAVYEKTLAPVLMKKSTRAIIIVIFGSFFILSGFAATTIKVGFDQTMAVSENSYLSQHFKYLDLYMNVGPPVYFVVRGEVDLHDPYVQNSFCTGAGCNENSFGNILIDAANAKKGVVQGTVFNWVDTYLEWISRDGNCCKVRPDSPKTLCGQKELEMRGYNGSAEFCTSCLNFDSIAMRAKNTSSLIYNRPSMKTFYEYLPAFMEDVPNFRCIKGGRAAFKDAISLNSRGRVSASHFMVLGRKIRISNSQEFMDAMTMARTLAGHLRKALNDTVDVFPYSPFYVFYEAYQDCVETAVSVILLSLTVNFVVTGILLGIDYKSALFGVMTIAMVVVDLIGIMAIWGIELNAISIANLVMALGISAEFVVHILRGYCYSERVTRVDRATESFVKVGSTIFSGLTSTLLGASVILAFSHSQICKVFFFRMVFSTVVLGASHGLIFLPVILSLGGNDRGSRLNRRERVFAEEGNGLKRNRSSHESAVSTERANLVDMPLEGLQLDTLDLPAVDVQAPCVDLDDV
ncbi:unnamed protein product [Caenorhabditis auriculariae]|uniref:SSD domain-containing protein n=1 Tax=Caenorhabditis auriculariae TaxID=2777116 RepID=A0A8S1H6X8_9PELO|nr:unnamed protein product [Caenorhabditis auriculariae]